MQSGVIRGPIRKEFITQHSTLSNHRPERILAHPARFLSFVSHRFHRFAQIILRCKQRSYTHQVSLQKTPKESKICENLCNLWENSTFNNQQSTFNINHYESKLEIRHQFHHHCPHRRSQLLLHAELQVIFLVLPQISQICTDTLVASNGLIHINSHSKENP